jgi:hypothetical protein
MQRIVFAAAGFYLCTLCLFMAAAAGQAPAGAPPGMAGAARLPPGAGRDATIRVCGKCHDAGIIENQAPDADGWKPVVDEMAKMSDGTDDDFAAITAYLTKAFPAK